ncbi:MAG: dihydrodipicolinate reductase [Thermoanaerobaculia bacterium]
MTIRVLQVGLGPIGVAVARQLLARRGYELVGGVDVDPTKAGHDLGEVCGLPEPLEMVVRDDLVEALATLEPAVAVICTSSSLARMAPTVETCLAGGAAVASSTEELAYPWREQPDLARQLDRAAKRAGRAILATGVNPGFAMDAHPLNLTAVCQRVDSISVRRVQDAGLRRLPFQLKIGAGLTPEEFERRAAAGDVRHVGLAESIGMLADAMGWPLDKIIDEIEPVVVSEPVASDQIEVAAGQVAGVRQIGSGRQQGRLRVHLEFVARLGAPESFDEVHVEGDPSLRSRIEGGIPGDVATASMVVNSIPRVVSGRPGLLTMKDLPPAYCWPGNGP